MMKPLSPAELVGALHWRYATQRFDSSRKIPDACWAALEEALVLTPSSIGLQPWKFFVVTNQEVKTRLQAVSYRQAQISDCSHLVAIAVRP